MDELQERFRRGLEEEMERRWGESSLAAWMEAHHREAAQLLGDRRLDWDHAAALFTGQGLQDGLGQPPTAETARETWRRVEERRRIGMSLRKAK